MLLASTFHKTAFIYFPLAYLVCSNEDMTRREMLIWAGVFAFFFIFSHTAIMGTILGLISIVDLFFVADRFISLVSETF